MKLVCVHGRSQQDKSSDQLREQWTAGLKRGFAAIGKTFQSIDIDVPYYGDVLHDLVYERDKQKLDYVIHRGPGDAKDQDEALDNFDKDFLMALARRAGATDQEILHERLEVRAELAGDGDMTTPRGPENWEITHALGRLLSKKAPWLAERVMARLTADVKAYLTRPGITDAVDDVVRPALTDDRCVVIAHSLGSVVAYRNLRRLGDQAEVPLFITVGSPLGAPVVRDKLLPPVLAIPDGVESWVNGTDRRDIVAMYPRLDRDSFVEGIVNYSDIHNREEWPHSIEDYLADSQIAKRIATSVNAG